MEFRTRRPSLPLGFQIGNLPPVQRPLHSDQSIEVYLLDHSANWDLLLVRVPEPAMQRLRDWWSILPDDLITVVQNSSQDTRICSVRVYGQWLPDNLLIAVGDTGWDAFLLATVNLLERAFHAHFRPSLISSLTWVSLKRPMLIPLFSVPFTEMSQESVLEDLATVLLSVSTGIDSDAITGAADKLHSWNRLLPAALLDILIKCLPAKNATPILSFDEFNNKVGTGSPVSRAVSADARKTPEKPGLDKIAGMDDLKEWLRKEIVGPLRNPEIYQKYRIGIPNGILFYGPPGCGKTYIARQVADELGYFFQEVRPSDVASPYIHSTVLRIRELFDVAVEKAPSVMFIDEFDAFAPSRSDLGGHQQYKAEEVNEFLANLEGCAERKVLVIAATNAPEKIDPAVRRTGRFDKLVFIPPPDSDARRAMLQFHLVDRPVESEVDLRGVAAVLDGYSASDIRLLVEEAARAALGKGSQISTNILLDALHRVPPSITREDQERFGKFGSRGI